MRSFDKCRTGIYADYKASCGRHLFSERAVAATEIHDGFSRLRIE
jgi:hypothetical protein